LQALTEKTVTDKAALAAILDEVRSRRLCDHRRPAGLRHHRAGGADPRYGGRTIAALNTSGYTGLVTPESLVRDRLPALREAASHIAHEIRRFPVLQSVLGG
jgi:IclR family transcriptional regulator, pca regulon regulatory protein